MNKTEHARFFGVEKTEKTGYSGRQKETERMFKMPEELKKLLEKRFDLKQAEVYWKRARWEYEQLLPLAEGESKGRKKNLVEGIYPFVAIYRVLLADGMSQTAAMSHMYAMMEFHTKNGMRKTYETMGKLPIFFWMFRTMFSIGLKGDSWDVEWVRNDRDHFEYNIKTCLWHDACAELGHPELCGIFCRNDEINFTDVSKHLNFKRTTTLGGGGGQCDFRFYSH